MAPRRRVSVLLFAVALAVAGCGSAKTGGASSPTSGNDRPALTVSAAASLKSALTAYGKQFGPASARFSFAGSDQLAAQIEEGVRPDVFAAANSKLPQALFDKGLASRPVVFTSNRLVIAVAAGTTKVHSVADIAKPGVTIAIGSASVPIGAYTRQVLSRLPAPQARQILANVRSNEPDVGGVIAKVAEHAVDAGFVYITDVAAAAGRAQAIRLAESLQPRVAYGAVVVKGSAHAREARAFIAGLLHGAGERDLLAAGFLPPPQ